MIDLSYDIHDGRELELMLRGEKPLSFFMHTPQEEDFFANEIERQFFDHVKNGKIIKKQTSITIDNYTNIITGYASIGNEWRIEALFLLMRALLTCTGPVKWSEGMERMLGELLGYTPDQIEEYIEKSNYE